MSLNLFARKDLKAMIAETEGEKGGLKRVLGPASLVTLGIGAIIGTGIFVLTGPAAALDAGPAVVLSFVVAAIASAFAGLCYAEFAALIPIAGSAYSYGYAAIGEIIAWIIGWALVMEYAFGAATVASGWSGYINSLLALIGINLPPGLIGPPGTQQVYYHGKWTMATTLMDVNTHGLPTTVSHFNLVAFIGIAIITTILVIGIQESANINTAIVIFKVSVLLVFVGLGIWFFSGGHTMWAHAIKNWTPFIPPRHLNPDGQMSYGWQGVMAGASLIFFSYIGFDAVSTAAQESKRPNRDMPIGILGSLVVCTILYVIVGAVLTGIVPYQLLNVPDPVALGVSRTGVGWGTLLVDLGAIGGLSSTMLVMLLGQSRVFFTMSHDRLLPATFSKIHKRFRTPFLSSILVGICVAFLAGLFPVDTLAELVNIGTLFAFIIVCASVWILRVREPNLNRPFKTPFVPTVPIIGIVIAIALIYFLHNLTKEVFLVWLVVGLIIYFKYSRHHSRVQQEIRAAAETAPQPSSRGDA